MIFFSLCQVNSFFLLTYSAAFGLFLLYIAQERVDPRILSLIAADFLALIGLTFSEDLITFFVFWELLLISSYSLLKYKNEEGAQPGLNYLFLSGVGAILFFFSLSLLYSSTGGLELRNLGLLTGRRGILAFSLMAVSFLVEAVIVPFHIWAPKAYETSDLQIVAFFASLLSKAGIFGLFLVSNFSNIPNFNFTLTILALISMSLGNYLALTEDNIKRIYAFGSITHLSFVLYAFSLGTKIGLSAGLFHLFNHAVLILGLFLTLDALPLENFNIKDLKLWKPKLPNLNYFVLNIAAAGIPPFSLFFSELLILLSSLNKGYFIPTIVLVFNMLLTLAVFLRVIGNSLGESESKTDLWLTQKLALVAIVGLIILIGVYPTLILNLIP